MRRTDLPDGFYHVTGRATGGELLYRADLDRAEFVALVKLGRPTGSAGASTPAA